jgi:hypothetical protein
MGNWKISMIGLFFAGMFLMACDKYDSKISGRASYINKNNNTTYPAAGAIITKMTLKGDSLYPVIAVIADDNGEFLFEHTTKGSWKLNGKVEKDSIFYFGISDEFSTNGANHIEQTILLEAVISEDVAE